MGRILGLKDGGSSNLAAFIAPYKKNTDKFAAPGLKAPVIVLFDNDSGAKKICSTAKEARSDKKAIDCTDPFTHIVKNLYILPTPTIAGKTDSKIEDFFDAATKAVVIDGKTFSDDNDHDKAKHYGKWVFADKVVTPHAHTIDFSGFVPLLKNISLLIEKYYRTRFSPERPWAPGLLHAVTVLTKRAAHGLLGEL